MASMSSGAMTRSDPRAERDADAFIAELADRYGAELRAHCYRMLGAVQDAEDVLQETLLAAWRGLDGFEGRSSLRTWLYRIATNRCLNALRDAARRPRTQPIDPPFPAPRPTRAFEAGHLEPLPDALLDGVPDGGPGPEARYDAKEGVALVFVAALQQLPPGQRAALVVRDVLGFPTAEAAVVLETTEASVKSALQRARAALGDCTPDPTASAPVASSSAEAALAERFAEAFTDDDVDGVLALLTDDAWLVMPPSPLAYRGRAAIGSFLRASNAFRAGRRFRLEALGANGQPGFAMWVDREAQAGVDPAGMVVLTVREDGISVITRFVEPTAGVAALRARSVA